MAIWQYSLLVIPEKSIGEDYKCIFKNNKTKYLPKTDFFWKDANVDVLKIVYEIDKLVKRADWSEENHYAWKGMSDNNEDNDGHIYLDSNTNKISEFFFRVDLREENNITKFLYGLVKLCEQNKFVLINLKGEILKPKIEIIIENLKSSNAASFLKNPTAFIENLSKQ